MIKTINLCVTISAPDYTNLSHSFDFSDLYNHHLAKECVRLLEMKYESGVSVTYLSVLSSTLKHYDDYLKVNHYSGIISYTENERMKYYAHLNSLYKKDEHVYSRNYIRFLTFVPCLLSPTYE